MDAKAANILGYNPADAIIFTGDAFSKYLWMFSSVGCWISQNVLLWWWFGCRLWWNYGYCVIDHFVVVPSSWFKVWVIIFFNTFHICFLFCSLFFLGSARIWQHRCMLNPSAPGQYSNPIMQCLLYCAVYTYYRDAPGAESAPGVSGTIREASLGLSESLSVVSASKSSCRAVPS